jgi:hypothetical protein
MDGRLLHEGYSAGRSSFCGNKGTAKARVTGITLSRLGIGEGGVPMNSYWRGSALALIAAGFCLAFGAPAQAGCVVVSGTADGIDQETAVSRSQNALDDYVKQYKATKHLGATKVSAMRVEPQPYWRDSVSDDQFCFGIHCGYYKPDIVTARSHTICWHGVVSPYVCTSGAKLCW